MTDDEWKGVCFFMERGWKGELSPKTRVAYRVFLDKFTPELVMAALQELAESGPAFLPAVPEIVQACRKIEQAEHGGEVPGWGETYDWIHRALSIRTGYFDSWEAKHRQAVAWLEERAHPVVVKFFEVEGFRRLQELELDGEYGALRRRDLKERWDEFVRVAKDRFATGLALAAAGRRPELSAPRSLGQAALLSSVPTPANAGELTQGG